MVHKKIVSERMVAPKFNEPSIVRKSPTLQKLNAESVPVDLNQRMPANGMVWRMQTSTLDTEAGALGIKLSRSLSQFGPIMQHDFPPVRPSEAENAFVPKH
jgi:hypothetical protein